MGVREQQQQTGGAIAGPGAVSACAAMPVGIDIPMASLHYLAMVQPEPEARRRHRLSRGKENS